MLLVEAGEMRVAKTENYTSSRQSTKDHTQKSRPLCGLLKLLQGQITDATTTPHNNADDAHVNAYRYHGLTLRESQKMLQKRKRSTRRKIHDEEGGGIGLPTILHSKYSTTFESAVKRHKFVAFFVVQGFQNVGGSICYSKHTLDLRTILATDYHDVMTTFVLDLGDTSGGTNGHELLLLGGGYCDEESGATMAARSGGGDESHPFCNGTGFGLFPTTTSASTVLALLNVSKIPSVVVLDASSGRVVSRDAILSIERNDSHTVVNRWQAGKSGLSMVQQLSAVVICDCSHGPCCGGGGSGGCCVIQ
jgi:hypothetical protein